MTKNPDTTDRTPWIDRRDIVGLIGVGLIGYGSWLVYEPAGFLTAGAVLAGVAIFGVRS
ncbi:hypothetical protein [Pseudooceanicola algae]|uniref:Uncharacterized protein n=1 Tax=Pseudooceanicola algae TaxID=1537215 RepID=A0A418SDF0_9RHOB|nr:hypothetical protein [Pseudooceanicola algae]QPM89372.1 hypothetical protein PSAL_005880 [Pseudooceanicola algae]